MTARICLISTEPAALDQISAALSKCGLTVWQPADVASCAERSAFENTLCLIIDMPGEKGLQLLEALRQAGNNAPAILVCETNVTLPPDRLKFARVLDVVEKSPHLRTLLGWIECICVANMALTREQLLQIRNRQASRFRSRAHSEVLKTGTHD